MPPQNLESETADEEDQSFRDPHPYRNVRSPCYVGRGHRHLET